MARAQLLVGSAISRMPRAGAKPAGDKLALDGLATCWEKNKSIRHHMLATGNLMKWPSPTLVGVVNFQTIALNHKVLERTLRLWLKRTDVLKTINIYAARREAMDLSSCASFACAAHALSVATV